MVNDKEREILVGKEMITKDQKNKESHRVNKRKERIQSSVNIDSKICIDNAVEAKPVKHTSKKVVMGTTISDDNIKLKIDKFELPENKKSIGNVPFKLIEPGKEPILEIIEKAQPNAKAEDEKNSATAINFTTVPNAVPKEEIGMNGETKGEQKTKNYVILEILESSSLKQGTTFTINQQGLIGSKRPTKDNCTYFGIYAGQDAFQMNDVVFPPGEEGLGKRHFAIVYDKGMDVYLLKTLNDGTGTFVRIDNKQVLTGSTIISFNNIHLAVIFPNTNFDKIPNSILKEQARDISKDPNTY